MAPKFPASEFEGRLRRLQSAMAEQGLKLCLIHTPENICYLTGHETPGYYVYQCLIVPVEGAPVLVLRETEVANAEQFTYLDRLVGFKDSEDPVTRTVEAVRQFGLAGDSVGIEERSWFNPPYNYRRLLEGLGSRRVQAVDSLVAGLRLIKSPLEIETIRQAARITNAAMAAAVAACRPGVRERDVAAEAMATLLREGSEYLGMEPFVASGPRSSVIHASWSDRVIEPGEPVLIEMAASFKRYHAALMYTTITGRLSGQLERVVEVCREALAATLEVVRPGNTPAQCHRTCCDVIEPAIRVPGAGGAGYSATVLVTETGHEVLTSYNPGA